MSSLPQQRRRLAALPAVALLALGSLSGCASLMSAEPRVDNAMLPAEIRVPAGHAQSLYTTGTGEITYECREKKTGAGHEWAFVAPVATLTNSQGKVVGKYYAGPTWEALDGSKVTGKQLAVSPSSPGNIPLQLVQANPAMGEGAMRGVSFIQRLKTAGGVAPALPCSAAQSGQKQVVPYRADYAFYKPAY